MTLQIHFTRCRKSSIQNQKVLARSTSLCAVVIPWNILCMFRANLKDMLLTLRPNSDFTATFILSIYFVSWKDSCAIFRADLANCATSFYKQSFATSKFCNPKTLPTIRPSLKNYTPQKLFVFAKCPRINIVRYSWFWNSQSEFNTRWLYRGIVDWQFFLHLNNSTLNIFVVFKFGS